MLKEESRNKMKTAGSFFMTLLVPYDGGAILLVRLRAGLARRVDGAPDERSDRIAYAEDAVQQNSLFV
jgi:hypothetical protein